jgi:hypothetical protein
VSWTALKLDATGWDEVTKLFAGALEKLPGIEARAATRLAKGSDIPEHRTEAVFVHFHRAPRDAEGAGRRRPR